MSEKNGQGRPGASRRFRNAPEGLMAVSRILSSGRLAPTAWTVICLTPRLAAGRGPCGLRPIPGGCRRLRGVLGRRPDPSCSVLHRMGFFVPPCLRSGRWAFTPPFHPCRPVCTGVGGMFSVTLSVDRDFGPGPPRILRGMLPCGVRTFLSKRALRPAGSDRPPSQGSLRGRRGVSSGDLVDFNFA